MTPNHNYLIISAVGTNRPEIISELARCCFQSGCNLLNSKINIFGQRLVVVFFLAGNWGAIAKMEATLLQLEQKFGITIQSCRTQETIITGQSMAYSIQ